MATSQTLPAQGRSPTLDELKHGPVAALAEVDKVESMGAEVQALPVFRNFTEVMPAPDFFFGGGMLLLVVLVHAAGMRWATGTFEKRLQKLQAQPSSWRPDVLMSGVVLGMLLLHLLEIWLWSAALVYSGLVGNWRAAGFFAANTYTTVGYGAFVLPTGWHMLAPIIAMSGLFTFGWTGSVLVEIVRRCEEVKTAATRAKLDHAKRGAHRDADLKP
jgi:hypothetical protein